MSHFQLESLELPLEPLGRLPESVHVFEPRDLKALDAAIAAGRPLLVRGEPGTGKSQLARAAAQALGWGFVSKVIDVRTEAHDLLWTFDAVRRLGDAQVLGATGLGEGESVEALLDTMKYVAPGPLWWAFQWDAAATQAQRVGAPAPVIPPSCDPSKGVVLLLDEIDKADSSVPNGLLESLGYGQFPGPEGGTVDWERKPLLVVITTNEERSLPDAFLRRCMVLQLQVPRGREERLRWLGDRGRAHFPDLDDVVLKEAARLVHEHRESLDGRGLSVPGGAEFLDLLRAVSSLGDDTETQTKLLGDLAEYALQKHPKFEQR